jgi:carbon starvation protein
VPGIGLVWDLIVTMTASWQKIFSDDPWIDYFQQASVYRDARDVLAPATNVDQMDQVIQNSMLNGTLQSAFALLVIVVVVNALVA